MTTKHNTDRFQGVARVRQVRIAEYVDDDGLRVAIVDCACGDQHRHVVPEDTLADAPLIRRSKCKRGGGTDYQLVEDWQEPAPKPEPGTPLKPRKREDHTGRDLGGAVVISDGPDRLAPRGDGRVRRIRQVWIRCGSDGNVTLIPASSVGKGVASCGCARGRPRDMTAEYDEWLKSA